MYDLSNGPFPVILSDPYPRFQGHTVIFSLIDALDELCAQLTRDLFAIAKLLYCLDPRLTTVLQVRRVF